MNHSQAVIARSVVVDRINMLQDEIYSSKWYAADLWEKAIPGTNHGQICFDYMNADRDQIRKLKRELSALAELSNHLKAIAKEANAIAGWMRDTEIDFDEVITDEDYHEAR